MFTLALDYQTGFFIHLALLEGLVLVYTIVNGYRASYNYVTDSNDKDFVHLPIGIADPDEEEVVRNIFLFALISFVGAVAWPFLWPIFLLACILVGLRKVFKFKRKIKEALSLKADKDHTH